jgi:hypothetical protein
LHVTQLQARQQQQLDDAGLHELELYAVNAAPHKHHAHSPLYCHAVVHDMQLQARQQQQLDDAGLRELELMLEEAAVIGLGPGVDPGEPRINYDLFTQVWLVARAVGLGSGVVNRCWKRLR